MMVERTFPQHLILDGGLSEEITRFHGIDLTDDPLFGCRLLSTGPEILKNVHLSFLESGSDVVETCTYQADIAGLVKHLNVDSAQAYRMMKSGVTIAREAATEFWEKHPEIHNERVCPLVAGSVGPYGACLCDGSEYTGAYVDNITSKELQEWHSPRIQALLEAGADLLALESIPAQKEAEALLGLLSEQFPDAKAWLTYTCKDEKLTCHGEILADAVDIALDCPQVVAVGINCTNPAYITPLLQSIRPKVRDQKRIIVYANSGEEWTKQKTWRVSGKPSPYSDYIPEWIDNKATWIGGCCRITHKDIRDIRDTMTKILGKGFNI